MKNFPYWAYILDTGFWTNWLSILSLTLLLGLNQENPSWNQVFSHAWSDFGITFDALEA